MRKRNRELHIQVWVLAALPSFIVEYLFSTHSWREFGFILGSFY